MTVIVIIKYEDFHAVRPLGIEPRYSALQADA